MRRTGAGARSSRARPTGRGRGRRGAVARAAGQDAKRRTSVVRLDLGEQVQVGRPSAGSAADGPALDAASSRRHRPRRAGPAWPWTANGSSPSSRTAALAGAVTVASAAAVARPPPGVAPASCHADAERDGWCGAVVHGSVVGRATSARQQPAQPVAELPRRRPHRLGRRAARRTPRRARASSARQQARPTGDRAERSRQPAAAKAAATRPDVRSRARQNRSTSARSCTRPAVDRRLHAAASARAPRPAPASRAAAAPGGQPAVRSTRRHIRTGSSAGPSAARPPARGSMSSPSTRTAKVSRSTSIARQGVVLGQVGLATAATRPSTGDEPALGLPPIRRARPSSAAGDDERRARAAAGSARTRRTSAAAACGCGVGIEAFASPMLRPRDHAALEHDVRAHAEERRLPQHEVGELADLDRADLAVEPVRHGRADRVLGDVAAGPHGCRPRRRRAARRAASSSRARSARCG